MIHNGIAYRPMRELSPHKMYEKKKKSEELSNLEKKKELWAYLKKKDYRTYMKIRYGILGQTMNLPGRSGRRVSSLAYTVARRLIGFN